MADENTDQYIGDKPMAKETSSDEHVDVDIYDIDNDTNFNNHDDSSLELKEKTCAYESCSEPADRKSEKFPDRLICELHHEQETRLSSIDKDLKSTSCGYKLCIDSDRRYYSRILLNEKICMSHYKKSANS